MTVPAQDNVQELCGQLLADIKAYKGLHSRKHLTAGGLEPPTLINGDDIWGFYKTVQAEYSAIQKVLYRYISLNQGGR
jgi:hypothetical protein